MGTVSGPLLKSSCMLAPLTYPGARGRLSLAKQPWSKGVFCCLKDHALQCTHCHAPQELDPLGKFRSLSDVWTWNATSMTSGAVLPLAHCCSHAGFDKSLCTCAHRAPCA